MADRASVALDTWHQLPDVQNLFAADLPWYQSLLKKPGLLHLDKASIENIQTFFPLDVQAISEKLRNLRVTQISIGLFQELDCKLDALLLLLESHIDNTVLDLRARTPRVREVSSSIACLRRRQLRDKFTDVVFLFSLSQNLMKMQPRFFGGLFERSVFP